MALHRLGEIAPDLGQHFLKLLLMGQRRPVRRAGNALDGEFVGPLVLKARVTPPEFSRVKVKLAVERPFNASVTASPCRGRRASG